MGGIKATGRMTCDYNVYFQNENIKLFSGPMKFKNVNFKFITESFFQWSRLNEEDFYVNKLAKWSNCKLNNLYQAQI